MAAAAAARVDSEQSAAMPEWPQLECALRKFGGCKLRKIVIGCHLSATAKNLQLWLK